MLKVFGKSVAKAGKYVGLTVAAAAVAAATPVFEPIELAKLILEVAATDGVAGQLIVGLVAELAGGAIGPVLVIALQQIIKHRDKLKNP